jgi:hypothetical protein
MGRAIKIHPHGHSAHGGVPVFKDGFHMNFQALNSAAERAYLKGENIVLSLHGLGYVIYLPAGTLTASLLDSVGDSIPLDESAFTSLGFHSAVPAAMSAPFFEEEESSV